MLRCEPAGFGPVASVPTVSRLIDVLTASGEKAPCRPSGPHAPRCVTGSGRWRANTLRTPVDKSRSDSTVPWYSAASLPKAPDRPVR